MKALYGVIIFSLLLMVPRARAAGPDEQYIQIFNLLQQGDALNAAGESAAALDRYQEAQTQLKRFQRNYPDWNPNVVKYRLDYLAAKIAAVSPTPPPLAAVLRPTPPPAVVVPAPIPVPVPTPAPAAPTAAESQLQTLQSYVRQMEADKSLLEAKLREALAARPANVDPQELTRAHAEILSLMKQNALLSVSLDQARAASATNSPATLLESRKALAEANKKLAQLTEANAALVADKAALQARVKSPPAPDAGLAALRNENEVLKKQLAAMKSTGGGTSSDADLNRKLMEAEARLAVLQSDKEMLRLETIALQNRVKQLAAADPAHPLAPAPANDAASAEKIRQLETQRDELQKNLTAAQAELAARKPGADSSARVNEMGRELSTLRARIEVLEARKEPYSTEELALLTKPEPGAMVATVRSPSRIPVKDPPAAARPLLNEARQYVAAGQLDKAEQKYLEVLKLDEKNAATLSDLASIQISLNHLPEAEKHVKAALTLNPDDEYSIFVLGRLRFEQDKYDEALEAFSRAAELDPKKVETQNYLGVTLSEKGLRGPAEAAFRKAIQLDPQNADAHANLAFIYLTQTPPLIDLARWHYEKALAAGHARSPNIEKLLSSAKPPSGP